MLDDGVDGLEDLLARLPVGNLHSEGLLDVHDELQDVDRVQAQPLLLVEEGRVILELRGLDLEPGALLGGAADGCDPTLVTGDGRFRQSWKPFIVACLQGRVSLEEVERELTAQIERLRAHVSLTHLDAHKHVHAYPPVFAIVARLAARFGIPVVRVPYERWSTANVLAAESDAPATTRLQASLNAALWPWARRNYRIAARLGLRTPAFAGRVQTGVLNRRSLRRILHNVGPGVTELMVHPGYVDDQLRRMPTRLVESRLQEVALLSSMETRALVSGERLHLVRHDLAPSVRRSLRHVS